MLYRHLSRRTSKLYEATSFAETSMMNYVYRHSLPKFSWKQTFSAHKPIDSFLNISKGLVRLTPFSKHAGQIHSPFPILKTNRMHTMAIAREIPKSFVNALSAHHDQSTETEDAMNMKIAKQQHENYIQVLRKFVPTLHLPTLEECPDCCFVEDTVVVIGGTSDKGEKLGVTACIMRPGHKSRRGEVESIKQSLMQLGVQNLHDMRDGGCKDAICDGGDVLYTGRHLFVGISDRTNLSGYEYLKKVFSNAGWANTTHKFLNADNVISVPPVVQGNNVLHLKSAVTHIDPYTLLAPEGPVGDSVLEAMKAKERGYVAIRLPDVLSCNAVVIEGGKNAGSSHHVIAQESKCDTSKQRIEEACKERGIGVTFVDTSELAKKDAALTCCSVLLSL